MINEIINSFDPITLAEMDKVMLMNRTDTKFSFNIGKFPSILTELKSYYKILEIDSVRNFRYQSVYFDTHDKQMFHDHRIGRSTRFKIRRREYLDSGLNFMEVKMKNAQGRTIKKRIKKKRGDEHFSDETVTFLDKVCPFNSDGLHPSLVNSFNRLTLVHNVEAERLTIDLGLTFNNHHGVECKLPYLVIAEVKRDGSPSNSSFIKIMKEHGIRQSSMSKYCIGTILLEPEIKHNTFKPKLIHLKRIQNDISRNS